MANLAPTPTSPSYLRNLADLNNLDHPWQHLHGSLPKVYTIELSVSHPSGALQTSNKLPFAFADRDEAAVCASRSFMEVFGSACDKNVRIALQGGAAAITGNYTARLVDGNYGAVKVVELPVVEIGDVPKWESE